GIFVAFACLFLLSKVIMLSVKKFFPHNAGFIWRQSLSNLFRPNNQTTVLVLVIGLGAFLISTLYIVQTSLLNQVEFVGDSNQSNTILFDIQNDQKVNIVKMTESHGLPVKQLVPIVTCRLAEINGIPIREIQKDTTDEIPNWALTREYRVTYRDTLNASEELVEGAIQHKNESDSVFVTISNGMQENLELEIGDQIIFDVQGFPITTYIGGIREVDWPQDPPNFIFVFPTGVLEEAPQIYVLTTRIDDQSTADKYSRELVASFPNVSLIDLRLILKTISGFFDKVSFVIRFMALFSIITGLIVLAGAVINSRYARMKENVLLRTLGAVKKQIVGLTIIEYSYLGVFAGLAGILLSILSGWTLSLFMFEVIFFPEPVGLFIIWFGVVFLTVFVGWWNTRGIINKSPLEILRKEV
ncbi:MAG: FtsX-like permease family protein, partial [Cyclobacteriaceae bacterium]|nr:FtsX-like permease family protein [Cyclobacteriaceae bacterium]